ncbi:protein HESO1-like [Bidens hawaiensis]|uniref:protein HESO1-like n=1 Tax=Bidens hawaiensis TaxID=980011 RepID=UPI004049A52A
MDWQEKGYYEREDVWQVLIKKAKAFEVMESQKILANWEQLLVLEKLLTDAYVIRRPNPSAYEHRKQVIQVLNDVAKDLYGNSSSCPVVEEFGSFLMDLFTSESDLDVSINFRNGLLVFPHEQKRKTLRKFAKKLYSLQNAGRVHSVQPVMRAKVPILKFIDTATNVECDISVENSDGISKSLIIRLITSIDERFPKLSLLMKAWAKAHDINSSKDQTLNSLSIVLLVAFHLQTRDPPILPPFSAILKDGEDPASVENSVRSFLNYGRRNTETLTELFVSFLLKLASVEELWEKGLCASPYLGHWTSKTWEDKIAVMSVEDFFDRAQNAARAVGKAEVNRIHNSIHFTIQNISRFMNVKYDALKLKESLFGNDSFYHPRVEPKLYVPKENHEIKTNMTTNKVSNPKGVMDLRAILNRGAPQHRAVRPVNAGLETPWAQQAVYNQGMRLAESGSASSWAGPVWTQSWGGGSSSGGGGAVNGTGYFDGSIRWTQPATDPQGRRQQQFPYGNFSDTYNPPFR